MNISASVWEQSGSQAQSVGCLLPPTGDGAHSAAPVPRGPEASAPSEVLPRQAAERLSVGLLSLCPLQEVKVSPPKGSYFKHLQLNHNLEVSRGSLRAGLGSYPADGDTSHRRLLPWCRGQHRDPIALPGVTFD